MKDKIFIGSELFLGKTIYLPEKSDSLNFIDFKEGSFIFDEAGFKKYVRGLKNAGVNAFRSLPFYFEPVDIEDKEGTGKLETKEFFLPHEWISDNKWSVSSFEQEYFDILNRMLAIMLDGGNTYFTYPIIDNCANSAGYGAWKNNINGIGGLYDNNSINFIEMLIDKLLIELSEHKDFIIWELGNEIRDAKQAFETFKYLIEKGIKPEMICLGINLNLSPEDSQMKVLRDLIVKNYGRDFLRKTFFAIHQLCIRSGNYSHPSGFGKHVYWAMDEKGSENKWMQRILSDEKENDIRCFISTDGTGDGDSRLDIHPRPGAQYRRRPSWNQIEQFLELIFSKYRLTNEWGLSRIYFEQFIKIQSLRVQEPFFKSLSELYKKYFDTYPVNYNKFPEIIEVIEDPDPITDPEPEPEIIDEEIIMDKKIFNFSLNPFKVSIKFDLIWARYKWFIITYLLTFILGIIVG